MDKMVVSPETLMKNGMKMGEISKKLYKNIDSLKKEISILSEKNESDIIKEKEMKVNENIEKALKMADTIKNLGNWFIMLANDWELEKQKSEESEVGA